MRSEPAWGAHGWESAPVWGPTVVRIPGQGALGGERPAAACTSIEFSKTQNASLYQTAQTDGGCGCNPPGGGKGRVPGVGRDLPSPHPSPIFILEAFGTRCPRAASGGGARGCWRAKRGAAEWPWLLCGGEGAAPAPGTPAASARVLLQRPLPIGLEEKVPLPAPEAGESEQRRRRGRAQTAGTWGCAGAERGAAGGAGPRSRSRAEGRPAAAVQPLTVRTDVLEAPSMGRKRNGAVMEAPISLFGAGLGPQIWGSLALGMLWARASNYGGGAFSVLWGAAHLFDIGGCDTRPAGQTAGICGGEGGPGSTPGFALPSARENLEQMSLPVLDTRTSGVLEQNLRPP